MSPVGGRHRALLIAAAVLAVLAIVLGTTEGRWLGITVVQESPQPQPTKTTTDPLADDPAPRTLLPRSITQVMAPSLASHDDGTATAVQEFWGDEVQRTAEDSAFEAWAAVTAEGEPTATQRTRERAARARIVADKRYAKAAGWLATHGCRDVWVSYAHRDAVGGVGVTVRTELREVLDLAARVAATVQQRHEPGTTPAAGCSSALRPSQASCQCSYPSAAVVQSAAARMYLSRRLPRQASTYAAMERQVGAVGLYQRRELPSDVDEGTRLGYLVGRYYLVTRGYGDDTPALGR